MSLANLTNSCTNSLCPQLSNCSTQFNKNPINLNLQTAKGFIGYTLLSLFCLSVGPGPFAFSRLYSSVIDILARWSFCSICSIKPQLSLEIPLSCR